MKILAFDTSMEACSTALYDAAAGRVLAQAHCVPGRGHAEILFAQIEAVMGESGVALREVDRFAVTVGPGTFTGVRIALAAARGLSLAAKRPLIGIGSLAAIAAAEPGADEAIVVAVDARRGELYVQAFTDARALAEPALSHIDCAATELARLIAGKPCVLLGSGTPLLAAEFDAIDQPYSVHSGESWPRASIVARLAARENPDGPSPIPFYLRAPDAKLPESARGILP
jgi:tRNA threonylcarbamoyl adenosine modification protein YeaZ